MVQVLLRIRSVSPKCDVSKKKKKPIDSELREMCSREGGKILCARVDGEHQENKAF